MAGVAGRAGEPRVDLDWRRHPYSRRIRLRGHPAARRSLGRILAAYGGVFVAGSLAWGMVMDGFRPDRYDIAGALVCLVGVAVIMYAPRAA
jgi:hypothetical protein